jgi:hypothetical protein
MKGPRPTSKDGEKIDKITRDLADQLYDRIKRLGYCVPLEREHEVYELAAILLGTRFRSLSGGSERYASDPLFETEVFDAAGHSIGIHKEPFWLRPTFDTDKVKRKSKRAIGHRRPLKRKEKDWHNLVLDIDARFRSIVMEPDLGARDGSVADFLVEAIALAFPDQKAPSADAAGQYLYRQRKKLERLEASRARR